MIFKKVDFFLAFGDEEKKYGARMTLDPVRQEIVLSDEKQGEEEDTFARIPYQAVTELAYEKSAHRRKTSFLIMKGKKHWLTIAFEGAASVPANYVHLQLDKNNYQLILTALEGAPGSGRASPSSSSRRCLGRELI